MNPRPETLAQIAVRSDSLEAFGRHFRDWLHELRRFSSRPKIAAALQEEPPSVARKFSRGEIADAWLAAYADHVARRIGRPAPVWAFARKRVSSEPWFAEGESNSALRIAALRDSPPEFKSRNLFTPTVDLPLNLHPGRPAKSLEEKRRVNAERQRRFRARRRQELRRFRALAGKAR